MDDVEKLKEEDKKFLTTHRSWACLHRKKHRGTKRYKIRFVNFQLIDDKGWKYNGGKAAISVIVPSGTMKMLCGAFSHCWVLESVVLPKSLSMVECGAFRDCGKLKSVFYCGQEDKWKEIYIVDKNELNSSKISVYFYSYKKPKCDGKFWHWQYKNGDKIPVVWDITK